MEVLDTHDGEFYRDAIKGDPDGKLVTAWLAEHGVEAWYVFRVEIHGQSLRIFEHARNEHGKLFADPNRPDEIANRDPYNVVMRRRPPVPFRAVEDVA